MIDFNYKEDIVKGAEFSQQTKEMFGIVARIKQQGKNIEEKLDKNK